MCLYGCCKSRSGCCYVAMVCTRTLRASVPNVSFVFQTYVASAFIWMLHMFHIYVVNILSGCCLYVAMVFQEFLHIFVSVSARMFQVFNLSPFVCCKYCIRCFKVDQVLHMGCAWKWEGTRAVPA
jgi:hypothetical protein